METLRHLVRRKKRDDPWEQLCFSWKKFVCMCSTPSLLKNGERNPWEEWSEAWEKFELSGKKTPKAGKQKAAIWQQLNDIAKYTLTNLERLEQNEHNLQRKLQEETKKYLDQKVINMSLTEELSETIKSNEQWRIKETEYKDSFKRVNEELQQKEAELKEAWENLEYKNIYNQVNENVKSTQAALEKALENLAREKQHSNMVTTWIMDQFRKIPSQYKTIFPKKSLDRYRENIPGQLEPYRPLEDVPETEMSSLLEVMHITEIMGPITETNIMAWLFKWQQGMIVENWTTRDFSRVLYLCMDSGAFSLLPTVAKRGEIPWLLTCEHVVKALIPESCLDVVFASDAMAEDESVMQYFNRVWMEYQIYSQIESVTRNDLLYKETICKGLDRYLLKEIGYPLRPTFSFGDILQIASFVEPTWEALKEDQYWYRESRKAGIGCPSRKNIWWRIAKYENPTETVHNNSYWRLVVRLSKYEDLETRQPRDP
ncbi:uncharacterized protein O3C94_009276 [Discoglossus pictus]